MSKKGHSLSWVKRTGVREGVGETGVGWGRPAARVRAMMPFAQTLVSRVVRGRPPGNLPRPGIPREPLSPVPCPELLLLHTGPWSQPPPRRPGVQDWDWVRVCPRARPGCSRRSCRLPFPLPCLGGSTQSPAQPAEEPDIPDSQSPGPLLPRGFPEDEPASPLGEMPASLHGWHQGSPCWCLLGPGLLGTLRFPAGGLRGKSWVFRHLGEGAAGQPKAA